MEIESIENGVKITIPEKENYTLVDLEQKIINYLYQKNLNIYTQIDYALLQWVTAIKN